MDFTLKKYYALLSAFKKNNFIVDSISHYLNATKTPSQNNSKRIILRHDVDQKPLNSLATAELENEFGFVGTYYFRIANSSFVPEIIKSIADLGHEIGYHYEDLSRIQKKDQHKSMHQKTSQSIDFVRFRAEKAIINFKQNLNSLRKIVPINTICMHGSPLSKWDSRLLWKYFDYRDFDIQSEPYFDIDFSKVYYITDTGRRWNGRNFSIRDKLNPSTNESMADQGNYDNWKVIPKLNSAIRIDKKAQDFQDKLSYKFTSSIIEDINNDIFPQETMITIHPQRWTSEPSEWLLEWISQNIKNSIKFGLIKLRFLS